MSILVYIESSNGRVKESSLEAIQYAHSYAEGRGEDVLVFGVGAPSEEDKQRIGGNGAKKIYYTETKPQDPWAYVPFFESLKEGVVGIIFVKSLVSETVAALLAMRWRAPFVSNVSSLPAEDATHLRVSRNIYTGKAFEQVRIKKERWLFSITKNIVAASSALRMAEAEKIKEGTGSALVSQAVRLKKEEIVTKETSLTEANIVVSGGRGLKGPEHWKMVETLAKCLGAATACSKPVSDMEWRPHHEHVGQTGIKISPDLYIAIGISGAIQHVAGVSTSKVIVVINKDEQAPFFKCADYGMVGDAFTIVPKLIESLKK